MTMISCLEVESLDGRLTCYYCQACKNEHPLEQRQHIIGRVKFLAPSRLRCPLHPEQTHIDWQVRIDATE